MIKGRIYTLKEYYPSVIKQKQSEITISDCCQLIISRLSTPCYSYYFHPDLLSCWLTPPHSLSL
ncbi:MAG: hypothetical protein LBV43_00375, partial [Prevotella sp.]|nr:hypothetical protein [Prevotella sp.]